MNFTKEQALSQFSDIKFLYANDTFWVKNAETIGLIHKIFDSNKDDIHRYSEIYTVEVGDEVHTFDTLDEAQAFAKGKVYYMYVTRSKRI